jgi:endonuclease YncB( thermonuclease family)
MMPRHLRSRFIVGLRLAFLCSILGLLPQNGTATTTAPAETASFTGKVVSIADGDTITVLHDHRQARIRLYGIDCPERSQPSGSRARQFTGDLAFGKTVTVRERISTATEGLLGR